MNYDELQKRYMNDPEFYNLVRVLENFIHKAQFTPQQLKEAAFFASLKWQMEHCSMPYSPLPSQEICPADKERK